MVIVRLQGGMGNQMFQYALGRKLSLKLGVPLKLDLKVLLDRTPQENFVFRDYDLDIFKLKVDFATDDETAKFNVPTRKRHQLLYKFRQLFNPYLFVTEKGSTLNPGVLELNAKNIYLNGFWQTEKYFADIANVIKQDFEFKHLLSGSTLDLANKIESVNSVCVNVRRADFVNNPIASKHHGAIGTDWYAEAIKIIKTKVSNPEIFVFSDEVEWCEQNLKFDLPTTYVTHEHKGPKFNFYLDLMTRCKHFVIPNSTFGWWAAWLANYPEKTVIAPNRWFLAENVDSSDIIPKNWIRL